MKMFRWKAAILHSYRSNQRLENRNQRNRLLLERRKKSLRTNLIMMINFVKLTFQIFAHNHWSDVVNIPVLFFYQFGRSQDFPIIFPDSSSPFLTNLRLWNFLLPNDHLHQTFKLVSWGRVNSLCPVLNFNCNVVFSKIWTHIVFNSVVTLVEFWLFLLDYDFRDRVLFFRKNLHFSYLFPFKFAKTAERGLFNVDLVVGLALVDFKWVVFQNFDRRESFGFFPLHVLICWSLVYLDVNMKAY